MFSHVMVGARDVDRLAAFYDAILLPLGLVRVPWGDGPKGASWRHPGAKHPTFDVQEPVNGLPATVGNGVMVAFLAPSREAVDRAYATALAMGGSDEGAPGLRPQYAPDYYGAYVRDPEGNKIHVVHRDDP